MIISTLSAEQAVTFESLYSFEAVNKVLLSPDCKTLAVTTQKGNVEENSYTLYLYLLNIETGKRTQILEGSGKSWKMQWLPKQNKLA